MDERAWPVLLLGGWVAIALVGWGAGTALPETTGVDDGIADWVVEHRAGLPEGAAKALTQLGGSSVLVPVAIVAAYLAWRASHRVALAAVPVLALMGAEVIEQLLKHAVERPRPPTSTALSVATGFAFPSGHATESTAVWVAAAAAIILAGALTPGVRKALLPLSAAVAIVVGCTRVYLGVHWTTDVLGGWFVGGLWAGAVVVSLRAVGTSAPRTPPR